MANNYSNTIVGLDALAELESFSPEKSASEICVKDVLLDEDVEFVDQPVSGSVCIISANTVIDGDIVSASPIAVGGRVNGNITTTSDLGVDGLVVGDVKAENISFNHSGMRGNSYAARDLSVGEGSVIIGDLEAGKVTIDGKVKGNINSRGKVLFQSNSLVVGGVTAGGIGMDDGARVNATIQLSSQYSTEYSEDDFNLEV